MKVRATSVRVKIDKGQAREAAMDLAVPYIVDVTRRVLNRATVLTPVDTGNLRARNKMAVDRRRSQVRGQVYNDTKYAAAVHDGAAPHVIRPRRKLSRRKGKGGRRHAAALKFTVGGMTIYRSKVNHPGNPGRPWLHQAAKEICIPEGFTWQGDR